MKNSMYDRAPDSPVVPSVCNADCIVIDKGQNQGQNRVGWRHGRKDMMITSLWMLEENGIDTTELVVGFENGDMDAIHVFFQKIRPTGADIGEPQDGHISGQ